MSLFDSLSGQLPKIDTSLPDVNLSSFLPDFKAIGGIIGSFNGLSRNTGSFFSGGDFGTSFKNAFTGSSWQSLLPQFGAGTSGNVYGGKTYRFPWDPAPSPTYGISGNTGGLGYATGAASALNAYAGAFINAAHTYRLDPNLLMAIAIVENGKMGVGDRFSGATGIMQIMPGGYPEGERAYPNWKTDANDNIMLGAYILSRKIQEYGDTWKGVGGYLGYGGADAYGTTADSYIKRVQAELSKLQASSGSSPFTGQASSSFLSTFGGMSYGISSENGRSNGMPASWYGYAPSVGLAYGTHPGIDVTAPEGTRLYMPKGKTGVVEIADGEAYGYDPTGTGASSGPQTGQLRIRFSDGSLLILGHLLSISVYVGKTVYGGDFLGYSGTAGSGAHVHYEYRIRDTSTPSGYRSVDPRQYL